MWQALFHLWARPSTDLPLLSCPAPATGQPPDPQGFYDPNSVSAAFNSTAAVSVVLVIVAVVICYQITRGSLGGRFVKRWWIGMAATAVACFGAGWLVLALFPTTALAGTCSTDPNAFRVALPTAVVIQRAVVGLVWGPAAYALISVLLTSTIGRLPSKNNGFFHSRGCPVPRFLP